MNIAVFVLIVLAAFIVTAFRGPGWGFALVYLPALVFFEPIQPLAVKHFINVSASMMAIFGIAAALPLRTDSLRFRLNSLDVIIAVIACCSELTAITSSSESTTFNAMYNQFCSIVLGWLAPYLLGRVAFQKLEDRKVIFRSMFLIIGVLCLLALIEMRFLPYFYRHELKNLGLSVTVLPMVYRRFGLFRACASFDHPIYFGNACIGLAGIALVAALTTGRRLRQPLVFLTVTGAIAAAISSLSFTPFLGLAAAAGFFLVLWCIPWMRALLVPGLMLIIICFFVFTYYIAHRPALEEASSNSLQASFENRSLIARNSWHEAETAPLFGFGRSLHFEEGFELASVDNSYLLMTMIMGPAYLFAWLCMILIFGFRATRAYHNCTFKSQLLPVTGAVAAILGVLVSMYTVWYGATYVLVWLVLLGGTNTLFDLIILPPGFRPLPAGILDRSNTVRSA